MENHGSVVCLLQNTYAFNSIALDTFVFETVKDSFLWGGFTVGGGGGGMEVGAGSWGSVEPTSDSKFHFG